jgi:hypothetical protein
MLYVSGSGKRILMVQTFADRPEWGEPYHIAANRRPLKWCLKLMGSELHPVPQSTVPRYIQKVVEEIVRLDPDIVGLGGMGRSARELQARLRQSECRAEIAYWGRDAGRDAAEFLEGYGVDPPY